MTPQEPLLVWEYIGHLPRSRIHCEGEKSLFGQLQKLIILGKYSKKQNGNLKWNFPLSVAPPPEWT